jgi:BirA family biotin operon repressor/biotin-[acetyl-CoA-carboxylase] ligase
LISPKNNPPVSAFSINTQHYKEMISPRLIHLKETDSTNRFLQTLTEQEDIPSGSIVLADYQTSGRGQQSNSWTSEAGMNLTFSVLLKPNRLPANKFFSISEAASLSVRNTLAQFIDSVTVKWSNDIYYKEAKISGILIENTITSGFISKSIIGTGININQTDFGNGLNATSLAVIKGGTADRMEVMERFRKEFSGQCERLGNHLFDDIHKDYLSSIYRMSGYYKYKDANGIFEARISDIEPSGMLVLERRDGVISKFTFKEVAFLI